MDTLESLSDKQQIVEVITDLFLETDRRNWSGVIDCFAEQVLFDMSSIGGPPATWTAATEIAAGWEKGLAPLAALHHQAGNFRVWPEGDEADAFCYGIAIHYRPNATGRSTRTFVGSYDFGLRRVEGRWRIDRFAFHAKWVEGNLELEKEPLQGGTEAQRRSDGHRDQIGSRSAAAPQSTATQQRRSRHLTSEMRD